MFSSAAKNPYDDIVAKATDENQTSEDWGVLSTVWDKVNDDGPTGARNCIGAIQKRLQHRNANVQLYALTLTDSLVNNCGVNLHREISSRAFTQTLSRLVTDRTTHEKVKRRTMQLLKNWSATFKKDETLGIVEETYETLKKSHRFEDNAPKPDAVPHSVLKQEEEDMQRAIAESEALAARQTSRPSGYVPGPSTSGQFFTQADGKALPEIQPQASSSNTPYAPQPQQAQTSAPPSSKGPSRVKALYDFDPQEEGELAFRRGDIIRVVNSAYEGWWKGELDGRIGIFPLTYIEIIPDPTPESIARDAETEAQVFAQAGSVDRLLAMLSAADAQGSSISEDDELMELYQQCILLRPKIVKLLDKYNQKQKDLSSLHDKFKVAKTAYDQMLEESFQRNQQRGQYGQPGPYGAPQQQGGVPPPQQQQQVPYASPAPQQYGQPGPSQQQQYPPQHHQPRHGSFGSAQGNSYQGTPPVANAGAPATYAPQQGYPSASPAPYAATPAPQQGGYPGQQAQPPYQQQQQQQIPGGYPQQREGSQPYPPAQSPYPAAQGPPPPAVQVSQHDGRPTSPPQQQGQQYASMPPPQQYYPDQQGYAPQPNGYQQQQ